MTNIVFPVKNLTVRRHMIKNDQCPECRGHLDTGWECNACGYDAQPELERDKDTLGLLKDGVRPGGPYDTRKRRP
jgi:tRNA(Ile2) C34 agmatinyltransferase TiaS